MVFSGFSGFGWFIRFPVAISRHACRVAATLIVVGLVACSSIPGDGNKPAAGATAAPTTPEARQALVRQRAAARWDLLIKGDFDGAYQYMSPGSRDTTTLDRYKANIRRDSFRSVKMESVACDGEACTVKLMLTYDHPKMKGITTPVVESWIVDGAQAWYVYGR